ncbi:MAG TPA: DUF3089 domain-containing protein [Caulobacteraceae bacterium]
MAKPGRLRAGLAIAAGVLLVLIVAAGLIWRDDILEAFLDPKLPFAVYRPPPPPNYAHRSSWAHLPGPPSAAAPAADVFFIGPTTFDGGRDWNGPINNRRAAAVLARVMLPNYAAPFARAGRIFAPYYRQASLYTSLTLFDDALSAREFAYGDVLQAFRAFRARRGDDRPVIVVGVEQGGSLASRLLREEVASDPALRRRLVAAYLVDTVVPADEFGASAAIPACTERTESGCVLAWMAVGEGDFGRAARILARSVVWNSKGHLVGLTGRRALCVNPLLGAVGNAAAPPRLNLGAVNATGLEWGVRPGFMVRQVGARCESGILRVTRPRSASLRPSGDWAARLRAPPYNLFFADQEADSLRRTAAWLERNRASVALNPTR